MKKSNGVSVLRKIVVILLAFFMILNYEPFFISEVNAATNGPITVKASEINSYVNSSSRPDYINFIQSTDNGINLTLFDLNGRDFNLVLDQKLQLNEFAVTSSNISISGNSNLNINKKVLTNANFSIEKNASISFSDNSTLTVQGSAYCEGNIVLNNAFKLSSTGDFCLRGGSITGSAKSQLFYSSNGNISIEGGIVDVTCSKDCFEAAKNISVSGGEISISCTSGSPFFAYEKFSFTGGTINASTSSTSIEEGTIIGVNGITIADDCVIKKPEGNKISSTSDCAYTTISNSNGTKAKSVTLKSGAINLSNATVTGIVTKDWTGSPITQDVTVIYKDAVLVENFHYTLRYVNNTDAGIATIYIEPINANDVNGSKTCTFTIKEHVHTVVTDNRVEPSCEKTGLTEGSHCSVCNKVITAQQTIPAKGHNFQEIPNTSKVATCTVDGKEPDEACTRCDKKKTGAVIKATGHVEVIDNRVEPTTSSTGLTQGSHCSKCGEVLVAQDVIPMIDNTCNHEWNEGVITTQPKCTEPGVRTFTCKKCGSTKTQPEKALGHDTVIDPAVAPTLTSTGKTEGSHCSRCHQVFIAQETVPMLEPEPTPGGDGYEDPDPEQDENNQNNQNNNQNNTNKQQNNTTNKQQSTNNQTNNKNNNNTTTPNKPSKNTPKYSNEWVKGKWYDEFGKCTYEGVLEWKSDSTGWWVEDSAGWYPTDSWQKIDGAWYYFKPDGYMASNEYYKGYWFNSDGTMDDKYFLSWKSDATGWWVEDISGWWPSSSWLKIDGSWYYFDGSGYMVTSQYVDGCWLGADGVCW